MEWRRCKLYSIHRFVKITEAGITIHAGVDPIKIDFLLWSSLSTIFCKSIVEIPYMGWRRCKLYSIHRFVKITEAGITIHTGVDPIKIDFLS